MREVGAFEAKNTLGSLLDRVEEGEEIVITRHGKPVARLIPNPRSKHPEEVEAAVERIRSRARRFARTPFDWKALKVDRDADRP